MNKNFGESSFSLCLIPLMIQNMIWFLIKLLMFKYFGLYSQSSK